MALPSGPRLAPFASRDSERQLCELEQPHLDERPRPGAAAARSSSSAPCSSARRSSSSRCWTWMTSWRGLMPRSWVSVEFATAPALVHRADEPVVGDEHVAEEHLVELGLAGDLAQRPHLDARRRACRPRTR